MTNENVSAEPNVCRCHMSEKVSSIKKKSLYCIHMNFTTPIVQRLFVPPTNEKIAESPAKHSNKNARAHVLRGFKCRSKRHHSTMTSVAPIMLKDRRSRGPPASQLQLLIVGTLCLAVSHGFSPFCPIKCSQQAIRVHCPVARLTTQFKTRKTARKLQTRLQTATAAPSNVPPKPILQKPLLSASALVILDIAFRRLFQTLSIDFPSSLAGCGFLLASLLTLPFGEKLYESLSPGSTLLAKWLPVFFVPSLITLPLEGGLGSAIEVSLPMEYTVNIEVLRA